MTTQSNVQQQKRGFPSFSFALSSPELPPVPAQFPHSREVDPPEPLNPRPSSSFDFSPCTGLFSRLIMTASFLYTLSHFGERVG